MHREVKQLKVTHYGPGKLGLARTAAPPSGQAKLNKAITRRRRGKLQDLLNMPLDVVFEGSRRFNIRCGIL
ncbi:uncharacterized protein PHACADRAFT_264430 [Phanerochaete carnosa HHB-10118-sp]|uniref:Uncharacterized protein n=1 Tax=Phanerochaete carnosa (strain HHB-10118-sp) TaxID=650164 RepID=K5VTS8_PHACS|nr:uncharacterized protein PHACADRAFT_264430 [Phanerochaete carnosa HHB-10118-sp]EKM49969.1 hypothetical protein PHACADRAFT_264430 [Phanerochaete carnosa HHB-10118-sp]